MKIKMLQRKSLIFSQNKLEKFSSKSDSDRCRSQTILGYVYFAISSKLTSMSPSASSRRTANQISPFIERKIKRNNFPYLRNKKK